LLKRVCRQRLQITQQPLVQLFAQMQLVNAGAGGAGCDGMLRGGRLEGVGLAGKLVLVMNGERFPPLESETVGFPDDFVVCREGEGSVGDNRSGKSFFATGKPTHLW
jgi:hypothetical protein